MAWSPAGTTDWRARHEVEQLSGEALVLPTDVADAEALRAAASTVEERFGPIDIWVNNAMSSVFARSWETTPEEFKRVTEVTYLGTVYGTCSPWSVCGHAIAG